MTEAKSIVAHGYDVVAASYLERFGQSRIRDYWLDQLTGRLPERAKVLDLGCGAGIPVARQLARRGHQVIGVDGSARQIALARSSVPEAEFLHGDMTSVDFADASFDAVAAFYSITHVPRAEHAVLLRRIRQWLKPSGFFLGSLGSKDSPEWKGEWLGTEMFFSHYDAQTNERLLREAGFVVERAEVMDQDDEDGRFLWVIARPGGED